MMNSTIVSSTRLPSDEADYSVILPPAISLALVAAVISVFILLITCCNKRLHTVNHLLICNTCTWSIFCAFVQTNNYIFVLFINWITSDVSCRWRAYFAYMTIAGVIYSYFAQAVSRLFLVFFSQKYPWLVSFKSHSILILCQWILSMLVSLPAIVTADIFYRTKSLCWVTHLYMMHVVYTFTAYYFLPTFATLIIYLIVYRHVKRSSARVTDHPGRRIPNRDLEIYRNTLILLGIYLSGGLPTSIFIFTKIYFFYPMGIIFVSLTMVVEKTTTLFLDREIRNTMKKFIDRSKTRVVVVQTTSTRPKK